MEGDFNWPNVFPDLADKTLESSVTLQTEKKKKKNISFKKRKNKPCQHIITLNRI